MSIERFRSSKFVREFAVVLCFSAFTALLTWPYIKHLHNAVVDKGDPYLCSWILWWDYHQTFADPLHLFNGNIFYPLKYTLAFSEHGYGISLLMFPFFATGLTPLTVQTVTLFLGFVFSGYGCFRLGRTLTGSSAVGWIAGIVFAFIPYRFHLMSQVVYAFSPWMPLVFEALVLFVRKRTPARATWLGVAFFMLGLSTVSWFTFTLIPFCLYTAILLTRYRLWRERDFWVRGAVALIVASIALLPFMIPYVLVSRIYGFKRSIEEIKLNSALPSDWLSVENRNKLWNRIGAGVFEGGKFKLFPGLSPILISLAALVRDDAAEIQNAPAVSRSANDWVTPLDITIVILFALSLLAIGFDRSDSFFNLFTVLTSERLLSLLSLAIIVRLCIAYPSFVRSAEPNLLRAIRSPARSDAFWLGTSLTVFGFMFSLGWNFFFFRICYDLLPIFRSMRVVSRAAMLTYLGLALLAGLGVRNIAERKLRFHLSKTRARTIYVGACLLLLFELNGAPLKIEMGDAYPDGVTKRLKDTPMRGGIVYFPAGGDFNHRYMLRAADHQKPLIVGTSGFNSPIEDQIENLTRADIMSDELMDLMESVPTSYIVVANQSISAERKPYYEGFLSRQIALQRLVFINRFDGHDDLYAVVKNEPEAKSEAPLSLSVMVQDWATKIANNPAVMLGHPLGEAQRMFRVHLATWGRLPRYDEFKSDFEEITRGVMVGAIGNEASFNTNLRHFLDNLVKENRFKSSLGHLNDSQYVDQLFHNAGIDIDPETRQQIVGSLASGETRANVLLKVVEDPRFIEKEKSRSTVLLYYFGYLRRNPDDPPDNNLNGFNYWVDNLQKDNRPDLLANAFRESIEYRKFLK